MEISWSSSSGMCFNNSILIKSFFDRNYTKLISKLHFYFWDYLYSPSPFFIVYVGIKRNTYKVNRRSEIRGTSLQKLSSIARYDYDSTRVIVDSEVRGTTLQKLSHTKWSEVKFSRGFFRKIEGDFSF